MPQREIEALLLEVDRSGKGELDLEDFTQLMVLTLSRKAARAGDHTKVQGREQSGKQGMQQASLPFEVVALAYRRCAMPTHLLPTSADCVMQWEAPKHESAAVSQGHCWPSQDMPRLCQNHLHGRCSFSACL